MASQNDVDTFLLSALKAHDPDAVDILATNAQTKLFRYEVLTAAWVRVCIEILEGELLKKEWNVDRNKINLTDV